MSDLIQGLGEVRESMNKPGKLPKLDGNYRLPDRRLLFKRGDRFTVVGHRDKKRHRALLRLSDTELKALLCWPGFGGHKVRDLDGLDHDSLVRLLYPRPNQVFHASWLYTSGCPDAKAMRKLARQAEVV